MAAAADFDHERYAALRGGGRLGARVHAVARTTSTMDDARAGADRRGAAGCGDAYVAGEQTAGRGRFGRRWVATPGAALLVTFHLCPAAGPHTPLLSAAGGLATAEAVEAACGLDVSLKWPNDVLADGRKLSGVLADARHGPGGSVEVFLGIGVNLREAATAGLPPDERARATSIEGAGAPPPDPEMLLAELSRALERRVGQLERDPPAFLDDWRDRLETIGRRVQLAPAGPEAGEGEGAGVVEGVAVGVTPLGELTLRLDDGSSRSFAAGDVTTL